MKLLQIRLDPVEDEMLNVIRKHNKSCRNIEALIKHLINAEYRKLACK